MAVLASWACGDGQTQGATTTPVLTPVPTASSTAPGADERATLRGTLTLDGAPLDAEFLGVRVVRDGLVAACQNDIPPVVEGSYEIPVASDAEVRGCGAPGAQLLLWTHVNDTFLFSRETVPWPGNGATATFDASFSSAGPQGTSRPVTEIKGHLFDRGGAALPGGTAVEAYAGDVLCGVTSLRYGGANEGFYTLLVAGPESVPGCGAGATLTFRLHGEPAAETAVNDLAGGAGGRELDLRLR